jgi:hypothetical protein
VFTGTSSGAVGNVAIIAGTQTEGAKTVSVRERFIFQTPTEFAHTWEQLTAGGNWAPTSYADCTLASNQNQQKS